MKILNAMLLAVAVLSAAMASTSVFADGSRRHGFRQFHQSRQFHSNRFHHPHRHARVGVFITAPLLLAPWWYPPTYYPLAVVVQSPPPVYIEQGHGAPVQDAQAYWYYCPDSNSYYPYVDRCAVPWQRVVPRPPPAE